MTSVDVYAELDPTAPLLEPKLGLCRPVTGRKHVVSLLTSRLPLHVVGGCDLSYITFVLLKAKRQGLYVITQDLGIAGSV